MSCLQPPFEKRSLDRFVNQVTISLSSFTGDEHVAMGEFLPLLRTTGTRLK